MKTNLPLYALILLFLLGLQAGNAQNLDIEYNSNGTNPTMRLTETQDNDFARLFFENTNTTNRWALSGNVGTTDDHVLGFYYNGAPRLICNETTGGVGIGTATPEELLHVVGGDVQFSGTNPRLFLINDGNADTRIGFGNNGGGANDGAIWYDSSEDMMNFGTSTTSGDIQVAGNGRVGINADPNTGDGQVMIQANSGTTSTPAHLDLRENNNSDFARLRFSQFSSTDVMGFWDIAAKGEPDGSALGDPELNFFYNTGSSGTNIMTIDGDDERVGIKNSSPKYTFDITHDTGIPDATGGNAFSITNDFTGNSWQFYSFSTGNLNVYHDGVSKGNFDDVTGNYNATSDLRLKKNIETLDNQLDIIKQLRPTTYQFKTQTSDRRIYGFIAQEVQTLIPDIVEANVGPDTDTDYLTLSYTELIPVLVAGMKEQQVQIEAKDAALKQLEEKYETLEERLQALEQRLD